MSLSRRPLPAAVFVALVTLVACTSDAAQRVAVPGASPGAGQVMPDVMPSSLLALTSTEEDVSAPFKEAKDRAYISSIRMWSLREGERLRATLQVARFAPDATPEKESFRKSVVAQIGQTAPRTRLIGDQVVYVTSANKQALFMWFENIHFILLSISADYPEPRALLRSAIESVNP